MKFQLILLLLGWISLWTYYYVCWHQGHCHGNRAAALEATFRVNTTPNLLIAGEDLEVEAEENIRYARSQATPIIPQPSENALSTVKSYFNAHEDEALIIIGLYDNTENNTSLLPNLGLARAEAFKAWLTEFGMQRQQIATQSQEHINLTFMKDTLVDGLLFEVTDDLPEVEISDEELSALAQKLKATSMNLYFETGEETTLMVNDTLRQYILDLKQYLTVNEDATISLVGHTDNVGDAKTNRDYGQQRADFTREILSSTGIAKSQIKTSSEGESKPIATNDTEEGRSKNRRVQIILN